MRKSCGLLVISILMLSVGLSLTAVGFSFLFVDIYPSCEAVKEYAVVYDDEFLTVSFSN